jgi:hypothetical protein
MTERILEGALDESKWLAASMSTAIVVVLSLSARQRRRGLPRRLDILWAMNLLYACMIGIMAFGHLLAVTIKALQGTLGGSLWLLYALGLGLAVPAWWLAFRVDRFVGDEGRWRWRMTGLNAWLFAGLLALGAHNWPLAAPAALNVAYQFHSRRRVGWILVTVAVIAGLGLFLGSLVFLASGQSFEQFSEM